MDKNNNEGCACCCAVILALLMIACMLCGCKTRYITQTEYKEVPVVMHDTINRITLTHDTLWQTDSVWMWMAGDTVFKEKYKTIYKASVKHDTTTNVVQVPVPVYQTTEKIIPEVVYQQKWWQSALCWIGGIAVAAVLLIVAYKWGFKK